MTLIPRPARRLAAIAAAAACLGLAPLAATPAQAHEGWWRDGYYHQHPGDGWRRPWHGPGWGYAPPPPPPPPAWGWGPPPARYYAPPPPPPPAYWGGGWAPPQAEAPTPWTAPVAGGGLYGGKW